MHFATHSNRLCLTVILSGVLITFFASPSAFGQARHLEPWSSKANPAARPADWSGPNPQGPLRTTAISERSFWGTAPNELFGYSVSGAGDVNGDGYDDIIVGAHGNDAGGSDAGRAYIYFGGMSLNSTPDVILTGASAGDRFGIAVSAAGDVNGDGYADVIIGADFNDAGGTDAGRAYIYLGGRGMDRNADVILTGAAAGDGFGSAVANVGDVNGDGYGDVIVGASLNDAGGVNAGRAYVFFGGAAMNNAVDVSFTGAAANDGFGTSVSGAGDINGDGYSDIIIGAPLNDVAGSDAGRAYVYFGGTSVDMTVEMILNGVAAGDKFGFSVSTAGDANGDGYSDIIVGAYGSDAAGTDAGRAYLYWGGVTTDIVADVNLSGATAGDAFGRSVSRAGDVNGDGYDDVIVGAHYNYSGGFDAGRAYVYSGGAAMDNLADVILTGTAGDYFGYSVASAGDVNGDGYGDLIVGAYLNDAGGTDAGCAFVYENSMTGDDNYDLRLAGDASNERFGQDVAAAGDVNGDGYVDIIVGANSAAGGGKAYLFFGGEQFDNIPDVVLTAIGVDFGCSVAGAGDVNGDGFSDVIVGGRSNDSGKAYIYYGGVNIDGTADVVLTSSGATYQSDVPVASAGDVNRDGFDDIIVGAPRDPGTGRAFVYYGGANMNSTADVVLEYIGEIGAEFGSSVAGAGDVNGDGYGDVIVGARKHSAAGTDAGRAYVFLGGTSLRTYPNMTLSGIAEFDYFGSAVAGAGDVNGDGFADIIVGAYGRSPHNISYEGAAFVYFGGRVPDTTADVIMSGTGGSFFGYSVAGVGDLNADGYDDILIGAYGEGGRGRAYVYFGGPAMDNVTDLIMKGAAPPEGKQFGISVSHAGDLNRDGYDDILVGDDNPIGPGSASIFLSSSPPIVPRISAVRDVSFDQGGKVVLNWIRSGYDTRSLAKITDYIVQRSRPPGVTGFSWESIEAVPANFEPRYAYTATTWSDSMAGNSGMAFYRVIARTATASELWKSAPISGYSIDNLAPAPPMIPGIVPESESSLRISWKPNRTDPDVRDYAVYRSTNSGFIPSSGNRLAMTADTTWLDNSSSSGTVHYYRVSTFDIHGNESIPSPEISNSTVTVEGPLTDAVPSEFGLGQNYPNPFNPTTVIRYELPVDSRVELTIYTVIGQPIATLVSGEQGVGYREARWDGSGFSSGLYFYRLAATGSDGRSFMAMRKMMLVK
jgi:hypothetical protein